MITELISITNPRQACAPFSKTLNAEPATAPPRPPSTRTPPPPPSTAATSCTGGKSRILQLSGTLADGIPVNLRDTVNGLDNDSTALLVTAICHAAGNGPRTADAADHSQFRLVRLWIEADLYYEKIRSMTYLIRLIMTRRVTDIDDPVITESEF